MPAKAQWLLHVAEIRDLLEQLDFPVIDRSMIEKLFGLRRRRAIELMHRFGGFQSGRTFLIDRQRLIHELKSIEEGAEFRQESRRRQRLAVRLEKLRRTRAAESVKIPVSPDAHSSRMSSLGPGVELKQGSLQITFTGAEDLLSKLFVLGQAAANDYDRFLAVTEGASPESRRP